MADIEKTIKSFQKNNYKVSYFETKEEAAQYLNEAIDGKTVGFGDSRTLADMGIYAMLKEHNTVYDPYQAEDNDEFLVLARKALLTDIFILSANGVSETGAIVNIDGTGNRVAGSLFGHDKTYFVFGVNKIEEDLERARWRARNIAAPKNSAKYDSPTPCVKSGKCWDCAREERICNAEVIYMKKMNDMDEMEVVIINEELGF